MNHSTSARLLRDNTLRLNFKWLAFWMKVSGAWHYSNLSRAKTILLFIYYAAGITIQSVWAIVILINHYNDLNNVMLDMIASQFQTTDIIIIRIIEGLLIQFMRALVIYYFWYVEQENTLKSLSFSINHITSSRASIAEEVASRKTFLHGKPIKRPKTRNYEKYALRLEIMFGLLAITYVVRKIFYTAKVMSMFDIDNNFRTVFDSVWYCLFEIVMFTLLVVIPYISNLIYIIIFLIKIECKLSQIINDFITLSQRMNDRNINYNINSSNKDNIMVEMKSLNQLSSKYKHDSNSMSQQNLRSYSLYVSKYYDIHESYSNLHTQWFETWERKYGLWQIIVSSALLGVLSVTYLAFVFYSFNYLFDYYYRVSFGVILFCPFAIFSYFAIRLNSLYQMLGELIAENIIVVDYHDSSYSGTNNSNGNADPKAADFEQGMIKLREWNDNVRLQTRIVKYPIQVHLFGYVITVQSVVSVVFVFGVSKVVSLLIEYRYQ